VGTGLPGNVRRNAIVARDLPLRINVDFAEDDLARLALCAGELLEDRRDDLAWPVESEGFKSV
jgi:hypothetical protein